MEFLSDLWLPILLSAVFVFVASSIIHMALPIHKGDFGKLPNEGSVLSDLRKHGVPPGQYMFPCAGSMKEMGTPEMIEKMKQGPVGHMTVLPSGPMNIGKNLVQWFLFSVVVGALVAYVARPVLPPGSPYLSIFRVTGAAALLAYGATHAMNSIWKGQHWGVTGKFFLDGVVYSLVTAGTFGWLWPDAAA